ncbi:MAG: penicillin-binding protein activator, partial [Myxococcota bacterium]
MQQPSGLIGLRTLMLLGAVLAVVWAMAHPFARAQEPLPPPSIPPTSTLPAPMLQEKPHNPPSLHPSNPNPGHPASVMSETLSGRTIGVVLPLSGPHKRLGQVVLDALTLARVDLGGLELRLEDSRGREEEARAAVERLAADPQVLAVLGPLGWKESRAAAEQAQASGVPLVSFSSEHGLEAIGPWVFRARPSIQEEAKAVGAFAIKDLQVERYAILYPDDVLGRGAAEVFYETVRKGQVRVTAMVPYKSDDSDLMAAVEALVGKRGPRLAHRSLSKPPSTRQRPMASGRDSWANFDAIFIPDYGRTVALATKFLHFHDVGLAGLGEGASVQLLGVGLLPGPELAHAGGQLSGMLYP